MRNVIIDSSSAILLFRCRIFLPMLKNFNPVIPGTVLSELTVQGYDGAEFFESLYISGAIKVSIPRMIHADEFSRSIHSGEREVISLFREGLGDYIIIDDGKGSAYCRDNNIPYVNALLVVKILYFKRIITDKEYESAWRWLVGNGRYSAKIIDWAENADEDKIKFFI